MKKDSNQASWILKITLFAFVISIVFNFISETIIPSINILGGIIIVIVFISIGVLSDMIGVAIATAKLEPINAMASKKIKGAKLALKLKQNADKVSTFCNDVVGDICGIVSGATGCIIALKISQITSINSLLISLIVVGLISSLTIGGKALEKKYAIQKSNKIIYRFSKILSIFSKSR